MTVLREMRESALQFSPLIHHLVVGATRINYATMLEEIVTNITYCA